MTVDTLSVVSLTFWLMIQVIIFVFCRRKLSEIQHQALPGKLKLRLLENGYRIRCVETSIDTPGVNTEEELEEVRRLFRIRYVE